TLVPTKTDIVIVASARSEREVCLHWRGCALHRPAQRCPRKQACGIERRQRRIRVVHDQRNLGAAEYDGIATLIFHPSDNPLKVSDRLGLEDAVNQLIEDDAIDLFAFAGVRSHKLQPARGKFFWINLALDQITSSGQGKAPKPALGGL